MAKHKREQIIQKECTDYLKSRGAYVVKVIRATENGVPDVLACHGGKFYAFEIKVKGKRAKVSELQKIHLEMIHASGGVAMVVDDVFDVMEVL